MIFGFLVLTVANQWGELQDRGVRFELIWLLPAFAVMPVYYLIGAYAWDLILRLLGYRLAPARAQIAWGQPLLARYVPGSVLYLFGRLLLSEREGVPRRITLASVVYEQALGATAAAAIAVYFVINHPDLEGQSLRWAALAVIPLALVVLHPRIFAPLANRVLIAFGRDPLPQTMPFRGVLAMVLVFGLQWTTMGFAVYFVARSVHHISPAEIPTVASAQTLGYLAALASLVFPAGLGVRDAAFAWAVKAALPNGSFAAGAVIAIAVRAVQTAVELAYVGAVTVVARRHAAADLPGRSAGSGVEEGRSGEPLDRNPDPELPGGQNTESQHQPAVAGEGGQRQGPEQIPGQKPGAREE